MADIIPRPLEIWGQSICCGSFLRPLPEFHLGAHPERLCSLTQGKALFLVVSAEKHNFIRAFWQPLTTCEIPQEPVEVALSPASKGLWESCRAVESCLCVLLEKVPVLPYSYFIPYPSRRGKNMSKETAVFVSYMLERWNDTSYSESCVLFSSVHSEYCIPFAEVGKGWGIS